MDRVLVHENFTDSVNDIALLRLGKEGLSGDQPCEKVKKLTFVRFFPILFLTFPIKHPIKNQLTENRVDLSVFSPACLPSNSSSLVGQEGHVYGEQRQPIRNA